MQVKRGGVAAARGFLFELTGGALCLDLANTVDPRPSPRRVDHVTGYDDLVAWGEQSGAISKEIAPRLARLAARQPARARRVFSEAVRLREAIYDLFSAVARGSGDRPRPAIEAINAALPGAMSRLRIAPRGDLFAWGWSGEDDLGRIVWPAARSAAELLASDELDRVRLCASETCDWLFLDRSRNRSRRWCDMTVCGNRDKARRHYRRSRKARQPRARARSTR